MAVQVSSLSKPRKRQLRWRATKRVVDLRSNEVSEDGGDKELESGDLTWRSSSAATTDISTSQRRQRDKSKEDDTGVFRRQSSIPQLEESVSSSLYISISHYVRIMCM